MSWIWSGIEAGTGPSRPRPCSIPVLQPWVQYTTVVGGPGHPELSRVSVSSARNGRQSHRGRAITHPITHNYRFLEAAIKFVRTKQLLGWSTKSLMSSRHKLYMNQQCELHLHPTRTNPKTIKTNKEFLARNSKSKDLAESSTNYMFSYLSRLWSSD